MQSVPFVVNATGSVVARIGVSGISTPSVTFFDTSVIKNHVVISIRPELIEALRAMSKSNYPMTVGSTKGMGVKLISTESDVYLETPGRFPKQLFLVKNQSLGEVHTKEHVLETLAQNLEQALSIKDISELSTLKFTPPVSDTHCFNIIIPGHATTLRFGIGRHHISHPRNALAQYELRVNDDVYMMTLYHPTVKHAQEAAAEFKAKIDGFKQLLNGNDIAWLNKESPLKFMAVKTRNLFLSVEGKEKVPTHTYQLLSIYDQQFGVAFVMLYTDDILKDMINRMEAMYEDWVAFSSKYVQ